MADQDEMPPREDGETDEQYEERIASEVEDCITYHHNYQHSHLQRNCFKIGYQQQLKLKDCPIFQSFFMQTTLTSEDEE